MENGKNLPDKVLINCDKPVNPDEQILPGVQKKFMAIDTMIPYIKAVDAFAKY